MKDILIRKMIFIIIILFVFQYTVIPFFLNGSGAYLDALMKKSIATFTILTGIKTTLNIIEGSSFSVEGGVNLVLKGSIGGEIEIGDIVQSVLDIIDYGWKISFFSMIVIKSMIMLHEISGDFNIILFSLTLFCVLIQFIRYKRYGFEKIQKISYSVFLFILMFYLIFPASVYFSGKLSAVMTQKYSQDYEKKITDFSEDVSKIDQNSLKNENISPDLIHSITLRLKVVAKKGIDILDSVLTFSIISMLDIFILPFALFYLFYKILTLVFKNLMIKFSM